MNNYIYADNAATTKVLPEVLDLMLKTTKETFGNPSSLHLLGFEAEKIITSSRKTIAGLLGVGPETIYFTSGATEANNWAAASAAETKKNRGNHLIADSGAHASIIEKLNAMRRDDFRVSFIDIDNSGLINQASLKNFLNEKTIFVSILLVNNETGVIQDLNSLASLIREKAPNAIIHADAVQALAKINDLSFIKNVDMFSASAHKFGGPKGAGFLYAKKGLNLSPLIFGGGQENKMRGGTENVSAIQGMAKALEISINKNKTNFLKQKEFKEKFALKLKSLIDDISINGFAVPNSPYIINLSLKDTRGEILVHALEEDNIYISTGSACKSKNNTFSHVLKAMHTGKEWIDGTLRISFCDIPSEDEAEKILIHLKEAVTRVRKTVKF